jgi:hypothetical protein
MFCCEIKTIIWFIESVHSNFLKFNSKCLRNFVTNREKLLRKLQSLLEVTFGEEAVSQSAAFVYR